MMSLTRMMSRRHGLVQRLMAVLVVLIYLATSVYSWGTYILWMTLIVPLWHVWPAAYWAVENRAMRISNIILGSALQIMGYTVTETGDDVDLLADDISVLICNHQSAIDVNLLFGLLVARRRGAERAMWTLSRMLRWTHIGMMAAIRGDFMLPKVDTSNGQNGANRDQSMDIFRDHLKDVFLPLGKRWLIIFPEGGYLGPRRERNKRWAREMGYPVLHNVLLPRSRALGTALETLAPLDPTLSDQLPERLKWVIDLTIGYRNGSDDYKERDPCPVTLHYRVHKADEVPREKEELREWMFDRFVEKDKLLEIFYKTGKFPDENRNTGNSNQNRPLRWGAVTLLACHSFAITMWCMACYLIYYFVASSFTALSWMLGL